MAGKKTRVTKVVVVETSEPGSPLSTLVIPHWPGWVVVPHSPWRKMQLVDDKKITSELKPFAPLVCVPLHECRAHRVEVCEEGDHAWPLPCVHGIRADVCHIRVSEVIRTVVGVQMEAANIPKETLQKCHKHCQKPMKKENRGEESRG